MTIEKLDLSGILGETALFRTALFETEHKINEIIDAVNELSLDIIRLTETMNSLAGNLKHLADRFENHINPNVLIPRFKEELLKCLEDDDFRIKLKERLGYNPVKHTWDEPSLAYKATAINRMQSESSEFPNLKLKEAEERLSKAIESVFENDFMTINFSQAKEMEEAYKNWKEARGKNK